MISLPWIWILVYNGIGNLPVCQDTKKNEALLKLGVPAGLAFTILQSIYMAMRYFEFITSEIFWALIPLICTIIVLIYFLEKRRNL